MLFSPATHIIVITEIGIYRRLASYRKNDVKLISWQQDEPKDLLAPGQKPIFQAYKDDPQRHSPSESFQQDMIWSLEVLHRLFQGETLPRTVTIRG